MDAGLRKWTSEQLEKLLKVPAEKEIVDNILSYDDPGDLSDFLGLFADDSAEHLVRQFVDDLFKRRRGAAGHQNASAPPPPPPATNGHGGSSSAGAPVGAKGGDRGKEKGGKGKQDRGKGSNEVGAASKSIANAFKMPTYGRLETDRRLMIIDAASGRHEALTNCLNCGKVVVEEEGWGPCLFCGSPLEVGGRSVRRGDERGYLELSSANPDEEEKFNASFERAKATKDRLLDYDRNAKARTKVYDDSTDWYTEKDNQWLSQAQREDAVRQAKDEEKRRYEEKRKIHAKIDLFGRTVISADAEVAEQEAQKNKENFRNWNDKVVEQNRLLNMMAQEEKGTGGKSQLSEHSQKLYDQLRASLHATNKNASSAVSEKEPRKQTRWEVAAGERVADDFAGLKAEDFSKSSAAQLLPIEESPYGDSDDQGQVLSMHQPWASLLVAGFKRAEGRSWSTRHRGRLWIHAAGKEPDPEDIELLEAKYRSIYEAQGVPLPAMPSKTSGYPTSVLLGCVDLEACWKQEEYRAVLEKNPSMPQEENDSDYIFWCLRPRRLMVPHRMAGDHHIWRLSQQKLTAAQRGLVPVRWPAPADGECSVSSPFVAEAEERRLAQLTGQTAASASSSQAARGSGGPPPKAPPPVGLPQKPASLDLWPGDEGGERLEVAVKDRDLADRDLVLLNGFVHLGGFIPADLQQRIVDTIRELGISPDQGFYVEQFDGLKASAGTQRLYLGQHWNAAAQAYEPKRRGEPVPELPKLLVDMYLDAVKRANRLMTQGANKKRKLTPFVEDKKPTVGVANFFEPKGSMEIHQDKQESKSAVEAGYAVMGICIGDACELSYSMEAPSQGKPKVVRLESGDVYLFGGPARLLWHGVQNVIPRTAPPSLKLLPGRLSVTLRVA